MRFAAVVHVVLALSLLGCSGPLSQTTHDAQPERETASSALETTPVEQEPTPEQEDKASQDDSATQPTGILQSPEDISLQAADEDGTNYVFFYDGEQFFVYYEPDCWKVYDSYQITNKDDLVIICQALLNEHEIHGRDLVSFRTAEDMAYEWQQHNLAFALVPEDSSWYESAQNVDLDPDEQNMSLEEILLRRGDSSL